MTVNSNGNSWQIYAGTGIGKSHLDAQLPNQDAHAYHTDADVSVAVVCDGAGSATYSQQGAQFFAKSLVHVLSVAIKQALSAPNLPSQATSHWQPVFNQIVTRELASIRERLATSLPVSHHLSDYHSTVSAVILLHPLRHAMVVQVGDSPIVHSQFVAYPAKGSESANSSQASVDSIDYFANLQVINEDKGEYVNETHFITQEHWQQQLAISWLAIDNVDLIAVMSDGCADLVLTGQGGQPRVYRPFFGNLIYNLCHVIPPKNDAGNAMVADVLQNPATHRLTGDDKTLIVLLKNPTLHQGIEPIIDLANDPTIGTLSKSGNQPIRPSVWQNDPIPQDNNVPSSPSQPSQALPTHILPPSAQTSQPATVQPDIVKRKKHRQHIAVLASILVLAGIGTLAWLNQATLTKLLANNTPLVAANQPPDMPYTPAMGISAMASLASISSPSQHFGINTPLLVRYPAEGFFLQVLMALPSFSAADASEQNSISEQLPLDIVPSQPVSVQVIHRAATSASSPQPTQTVTKTSVPVVTSVMTAMTAAMHCQAIDQKTQPRFQSLGIALQANKIYRYCRIDFHHQPASTSPAVAIDKANSQLFFDQGLLPLLPVAAISASSAKSTLAPNLNPKQSKQPAYQGIRLYYLPNDFSLAPVPAPTK